MISPECRGSAIQVILWDEVGEEEGTGIVYIAPGCGAGTFQLSFETALPRIAPRTERDISSLVLAG